MRRFLRTRAASLITGIVWLLAAASLGSAAPGPIEPQPGWRIVLEGGTLAERMQLYGHFETLLHSRFPQHRLVVRNLGWSADELSQRLRSLDFKDHGHRLQDHKPDLVIAFFGFNESFQGPDGLAKFRSDLENYIRTTTSTAYNGTSPPQLIVVSPIASENLGRRELPDGSAINRNLEMYVAAMGEIAAHCGVHFIDLFSATGPQMQSSAQKLTINGIHLNEYGDRIVAGLVDKAIFGERPAATEGTPDLERIRAEVNEKNLQFWYDYRAVNGYYIYGGRKEPFGVVNFPHEFRKLRKMIEVRDARIWQVARGESVPSAIDDSGTGDIPPVESNFAGDATVPDPDQALAALTPAEGFAVNLFASEREFPELQNPCQMAFDGRGRLWVCVMPGYPMYLPGRPVHDKVLILEDSDGDGSADKQTVFADGLHVPTGLELGDGGLYLAQQPNLMFLKDTDGDDRADVREIMLHGFDSADSHHSISAFTWCPGGALYFQEGTFHQSQVETPHGPVRLSDAGVFRYEPRTGKLSAFVSYPFANPWGHIFDRWGQNFVADASGGANYYGTAFSGHVDYPQKHSSMKQFIEKRVRPTSGCEIVSSRHFPDEAQGWFLLNNCIGEQAVLRHELTEEGSGFAGREILPPLVRSSDPNFRPVDLQLGLDGALYVVDWCNPLVGHMQHSIRDPKRDHSHGRIWRITCPGRPLLTPPKIVGTPLPQLLDLLKAYEDRTRYHARRELRERDTGAVIEALRTWLDALDPNDPGIEHHRLEALWVFQHHDVVDEPLLVRLLESPEPRARAAATRVLCYWRDRISDPLGRLKRLAQDEHPRVALEAVRAASFFRQREAADAALASLARHGNDDYIKYTLKETMTTLRPYLTAAP